MLHRLNARPRFSSVVLMTLALSAILGLALAGCGAAVKAETTASTALQTPATQAGTQSTAPTETTVATATPSTATTAVLETEGDGFFDSTTLHEISVTFSQEDYDAMIQTYQNSGTKDWIKATVTIDGVTYKEAGMRLKGNSSIMGLRNNGRAGGPGGNVSASEPQGLPWLIRLDKYVDGQTYKGLTDLVVRSNTSSTSLNEAVALDLLNMAGLASVTGVECRFSVNGGDEVIRLATQLPDDAWMQEEFGSTGSLYKAEASGDYSYRGDDPDSYADVFDQEAGKGNADLTPLIDFLKFINNSDDATFAAELPKRLNVDAFATYLAMEELVSNFDDIDGPGNNSYLYYDPSTGMFTIVPWDHNLAFGAMNRGKGDAPAIQTQPNGQQGVATAQPSQRGGDRQPGQGFSARGKSNILVTRFLANTDFKALYEQKLDELRSRLYASGAAQQVLDKWVNVLKTQATGLLDSTTIDTEAAKIAAYFTSTGN
jgi:spore coat protein CotH